jgi:hypothetical protein
MPAGTTTENDNIQQGVAHQPVGPVNAAGCLTGNVEVFNGALPSASMSRPPFW